MTVGEKIKSLRKAIGLTQKELGDRLGISEVQVSQYERGTRNPKTEQLKRIAEALNVPLDTFYQAKVQELYMLWSENGSQQEYYSIEQKLNSVGFAFWGDLSEGDLWIEYPDGTLEVTEEQLLALNSECDEFLRFKLEELKRKNASDFKAKK